MVKVRHSTGHLNSLGTEGLAAALKHMLLGDQPATAQNLQQVANKILDAARYLQSQADSIHTNPDKANQQQQQQQPCLAQSLAPALGLGTHEHLHTHVANGDLQRSSATSVAQSGEPVQLSSSASQPGPEALKPPAAPQIITAEGQSRRGKRKLGTVQKVATFSPASRHVSLSRQHAKMCLYMHRPFQGCCIRICL